MKRCKFGWMFIIALSGLPCPGCGNTQFSPPSPDVANPGQGSVVPTGKLTTAPAERSGPGAPGAPARGAPEARAQPVGTESSRVMSDEDELLQEIDKSLQKSLVWLMSKQNPDGGYGPSMGIPNTSDLGLTCFALYALVRSPRRYKESDGPSIARAVEFMTSRQQESGAFYDARDPSLQNYKTSVAILALHALDSVKYYKVIQKAAAFVKSQQFTEAGGYVRDRDVRHGGIGYGSDKTRPDLSNSQFSAEALHVAGVSGSDEVWVRLQAFLERCQNGEKIDPLLQAAGVGTSGDGGFRYRPDDTRGNVESIDGGKIFSSYGSMTYAGLKSMLYANLTRDDRRVQAAFKWIQGNFTVTENPGMATPADPGKGQQGLFYYYHTMAKALAVYGEPVITDPRGVKHLWPAELGRHLLSIQKPEGYWDNPAERWLEGIEVLDTSYAIIALTVCKEELEKFLESKEIKK